MEVRPRIDYVFRTFALFVGRVLVFGLLLFLWFWLFKDKNPGKAASFAAYLSFGFAIFWCAPVVVVLGRVSSRVPYTNEKRYDQALLKFLLVSQAVMAALALWYSSADFAGALVALLVTDALIYSRRFLGDAT